MTRIAARLVPLSATPMSTRPAVLVRRRRPAALLLLALAAAGCAPRAQPLSGVPAPAAFPDTRLRGAERVVFRWRYDDGSLVARGEGVARIAAPDSVRLDLFVDGGMGGGTAFLIGDRLEAPGGAMVRGLLPPPPLLWAALGRLAVPAAADTTARMDGGVLRADIGTDPAFRAAFAGPALRRLERIEGGRVQEWVDRGTGTAVEYRHEASGRKLSLDISSRERVEAFDASIWQR